MPSSPYTCVTVAPTASRSSAPFPSPSESPRSSKSHEAFATAPARCAAASKAIGSPSAAVRFASQTCCTVEPPIAGASPGVAPPISPVPPKPSPGSPIRLATGPASLPAGNIMAEASNPARATARTIPEAASEPLISEHPRGLNMNLVPQARHVVRVVDPLAQRAAVRDPSPAPILSHPFNVLGHHPGAVPAHTPDDGGSRDTSLLQLEGA